ncbi:hypothetical protein CHARACLAT_020534 [Characodon lateralis]|uniref:Uncharacterized protein n=1 Tax=Characodon lateralis TaxID=208331 RepID=A0ABU7F762_9TELE|nr:hypothetical protein [Characodon lateralis]
MPTLSPPRPVHLTRIKHCPLRYKTHTVVNPSHSTTNKVIIALKLLQKNLRIQVPMCNMAPRVKSTTIALTSQSLLNTAAAKRTFKLLLNCWRSVFVYFCSKLLHEFGKSNSDLFKEKTKTNLLYADFGSGTQPKPIKLALLKNKDKMILSPSIQSTGSFTVITKHQETLSPTMFYAPM